MFARAHVHTIQIINFYVALIEHRNTLRLAAQRARDDHTLGEMVAAWPRDEDNEPLCTMDTAVSPGTSAGSGAGGAGTGDGDEKAEVDTTADGWRSRRAIHCYNTFFCTRLSVDGYCYPNIKHWSKDVRTRRRKRGQPGCVCYASLARHMRVLAIVVTSAAVVCIACQAYDIVVCTYTSGCSY